ncbi:FAD dependent oxidoreductase [Emticicia oligotrophica DSM 17448]|uniref:FAD dependent oxidoreductase n=1 Tax=Emticicia oligotrophica (strain DSM 17448 / CIP 109782 / MTCC 6937 / GPTSA100-15) TaxID=929562 RepID=A0ABM5MZV3_EMTOG|nr:flavin-dependent oxidoreductase [Emticicia oligotrophica]AFK02733.1 FAD dependent oxidoreductase [Emticicia oligotrophica DSM 17448]
MKVIIIGGGIGGLTTALSLHEAGFEVKVFESVKEIKPLGVGINILPHCVRVLTNLGLQEKIAQNAIETSDLVYFNRFGQQFWTEPRGRFAGYKWPQFSVHRGVLQMLLFDEVVERMGVETITKNHHLSHFEQNQHEVIAHFIDKETGEKIHEERGDILIGADGINSVVRQQLYPNEGPPVYSENVLYRGTTIMKPFLNGNSMAMIGSLRQKMVVYPIGKPDADGNCLVNWVGNLKEGKSKLTARDWNREADKARLVEIYKTWNFDWLDVPKMIDGAKAVYEFPMSDRNPLDKWTFGRVTLLGDAAHPMYPIGSNGASQAILDADCLTECLKNTSSIEEALIEYDKERVPAAAKVVLQNRAKGPDEIMDMMEDWFPNGFLPEEVPHDKLAAVMDNYKKVAGFDIQTLNQKK